ncbi:MAG: hypothetical protein DRQ45_02740, partial [Gammaproteobacteria bacterium]
SRLPLLMGLLSILLIIGLAAGYQSWKRSEVATVAGSVAKEAPVTVPAAEAVDEVVTVVDQQLPAEESAELAAEEPEHLSLATLLAEADSSYYRSAWTELFALWSVVLPESVTPDFCDFSRQYGLLCLEERGNWNTLRQFDRPVVLTLVAADGERVAVLLQHLDDSVAEIIVGNELYRLTPDQVKQNWYGEFTLLLQGPPGGRLFLRAGDRDPVVSWIRDQLEIAQGINLPAADPLNFDYALQSEVLAFQRDHGLSADGVVGKYTMIHLNTASGREGVPRLSLESS